MTREETVVYIADDGTRFDDEDDCFLYEFDQKLKKSHLFMLSTMSGTDAKLEYLVETKNPSDAVYIEITDEYDMDVLRMWRDYDGTVIPPEIGKYKYNWSTNEWDNIDEMLAFIKQVQDVKAGK